MYPPHLRAALASKTHAYQQAKARYGLELTYGDLYDMVQAVESGIGVLLYRRKGDDGKPGAAYAIPFAGRLLPIALIEHDKTGYFVTTVLPTCVLFRKLTPRTIKKLDKLQAKIDAANRETTRT